jgi:hypothetical protein
MRTYSSMETGREDKVARSQSGQRRRERHMDWLMRFRGRVGSTLWRCRRGILRLSFGEEGKSANAVPSDRNEPQPYHNINLHPFPMKNYSLSAYQYFDYLYCLSSVSLKCKVEEISKGNRMFYLGLLLVVRAWISVPIGFFKGFAMTAC